MTTNVMPPANTTAQRLKRKQINTAELSNRLAYSVDEAAFLLGMSYPSLYRLIQRGKVKPCKALRHLRISRAELDRFLKETTV